MKMTEDNWSTLLLVGGTLMFGVHVIRTIGAALGDPGAPPLAAAPPPPSPLPNRSFYCLELSYDFDGGHASTELYVYRSLEFIRECARQMLRPRSVSEIEHVLWLFSPVGGRDTARLFAFIGGRMVSSTSLVEHLRVRAGNESSRVDVSRTQSEADRLAALAELELDWVGAVASMPPLTGEVLRPGEVAQVVVPPELEALWVDEDEPSHVTYGFQDLQDPETPATGGFLDPDPPTAK